MEAGSRPRRCRGPARTVACQCPLEQETAADAEGILRMLSEVQLRVPLGERALRLPLPGIRGLSAFLLLAQGLRLGGWGLETQGQGSPGPGYAGRWPEQILTHHWWGQGEKLGDKGWRQQKCSLQRLRNCLGGLYERWRCSCLWEGRTVEEAARPFCPQVLSALDFPRGCFDPAPLCSLLLLY